MTGELKIISAASVTLEEFAAAFVAAFNGYFFPMALNAEQLSRRVRFEHLDITHSLLAYDAYDADRLVGMAMLGLRRDVAWVGGFGITPEYRGRGRAHPLMTALIEEARRCQARTLTLEVLRQNSAAIRLYERAGMVAARDLIIYERVADKEGAASGSNSTARLLEAPPVELLQHFQRLHVHPPAWQRDLAALLVMEEVRGLYMGERERPQAYALFREGPNDKTYIVDLGARHPADADALCAGVAVQAGRRSLRIVNEPESSIFCAALLAHGFVEAERQHEMRMAL